MWRSVSGFNVALFTEPVVALASCVVCVCAWHVVLCLLCMCHGLTRVWHVVLATTSTQPPMNQLRCIPLVKVDYLNARLQPGGQCLHHFRIAVALLHVW